MNSIKCKYCELPNFADAVACSRCGNTLRKYKDKRQRKFSVLSVLTFAAIAVLLYYMYGGFESSLDKVNAIEANKIATDKRENPAGLSRSEYDRQRAGQYGTAVQNSNSLSENQRHNQEIQNTMQSAQGSR